MTDPLEGIWTPHPGQARFLSATARVKVLACGRRWGKTDVCAATLVRRLFRGPPSTTLVVAPTLGQAEILLDRVQDLLEARGPGHAAPRVRRSPYPRLSLDGSRILVRSGHRPRSLRGHGADHVVVDEAAYLEPGLLAEVLMPTLATSHHATLTLASTPNGLNEFWRWYDRGRQGDAEVYAQRSPTSENPAVSRDFLELVERTVPLRTFRREYLAEFGAREGAVFEPEALLESVGPVTLEPAAPAYVGVDWGRFRDFTAAVVLQGSLAAARVVRVERMTGLAFGLQVARLRDRLADLRVVRIVSDATGLGAAATEILADAFPEARLDAVQFTAESKAQIVDRLASLFERRRLRLPEHDALREELEGYAAAVTPHGRVRFGGTTQHDDLVIALALATWALPPIAQVAVGLGPVRLI